MPPADAATPELLPERLLEQAAGVLRVLAHPHRLRIVELLSLQRHTVGELAEAIGLAQHAVSQHLNHMKAHGILDSRRVGRNVYYSVANPNALNILECIRNHGHGKSTL